MVRVALSVGLLPAWQSIPLPMALGFNNFRLLLSLQFVPNSSEILKLVSLIFFKYGSIESIIPAFLTFINPNLFLAIFFNDRH